MTDEKAARLADIRAANARKQMPASPTAAGSTGEIPPPPPATPAQPMAGLHTDAAAGPNGGATIPLSPLAPNVAPQVHPRPRAASLADEPVAMSPHLAVLLLLAAAAGAVAAVVALPAWLPGLSTSLPGPEPKGYWYLARSSAFVAYGLLWLSMVFGLLMTSKLSRAWPGGPTAFELHQHASLLGLAFALFHALILIGDSYIQANLLQVLVPFAYVGYEPLWVGLGQLGLYLLAIVGLSFYFRPLIGRGAWRLIHFLSFALFILVLLHGIYSGSDSAQPWVQGLYWATGGSTLFLLCYRVLASAGGLTSRASARTE